MSPAENSKPPSGGSINDRCLNYIKDATRSESIYKVSSLHVCVFICTCVRVCVNAYVHVSGMCTCVCVYYQIMYVFR